MYIKDQCKETAVSRHGVISDILNHSMLCDSIFASRAEQNIFLLSIQNGNKNE